MSEIMLEVKKKKSTYFACRWELRWTSWLEEGLCISWVSQLPEEQRKPGTALAKEGETDAVVAGIPVFVQFLFMEVFR